MPDSLQSVLANIPGLAGYRAAEQNADSRQLGQLQQAVSLQSMLEHITKSQQEQKFRADLGALGANPSQESLAQVAARYSTPADVLKSQTSSLDRKAQIDATKEAARSRLQQAAAQFETNTQMKLRQATNTEERNAILRDYEQGRLQLQAASINATGERLFYDTGTRMPTVAAPQVGAPNLNSLPPTRAGQPAADALPGNVPASDRAAYQAALAGGSGTVNRVMPDRETAGMTYNAGAPEAAPLAQPPAPANDFDVRDLRAQALQRAQQAAQAAAPSAEPGQAPARPVMPPEIAAAPKRIQDRWMLEQNRASMAGAASLSPEALKFTAQQYLTGDRQAVVGYARSAPLRAALQETIVKEALRQGITGPDLAAKMADFAGIMAGSRTVGTRSAQIELASSEAQKMIDIVETQSKKFDRTNFVPFNMALKAYDTGTGKPEVKAFGASINSLVNVYARAISPTGVPTQSDKDHAREMLGVIHSPDQVSAVLDILRQEMTAARAAPAEVRESQRRAVVGGRSGAPKKAEDFFR